MSNSSHPINKVAEKLNFALLPVLPTPIRMKNYISKITQHLHY